MVNPKELVNRGLSYISPFDKLIELPRNVKQALMLGIDLFFIPLALFLAVALRWGHTHFEISPYAYVACMLTMVFSAAIFLRLGLYRAVIRFMGHQAILAIIKAVTISALLLGLFMFVGSVPLPRSTPFLYWCFAMLLIGGSRLVVRAYYQYKLKQQSDNVVIYGAGASGRQLLTALLHGLDHHPVFFVDDDESLYGSVINGVPVESSDALPRLIKQFDISQVLLAMPSVASERRREVINKLVGLPVYVKTIPAFADLIHGTASITEIQDIEIEDLLGRNPVPPHPELIDQCVAGKVVLVTGAGGSIGSELCRQIVAHKPKELILLDTSEYALYVIERDLRESLAVKSDVNVVALLGSVKDKPHISQVMNSFAVQTVYHAAAYKHVPLVEFNVVEGVRNNVFGTVNAAVAAIEAGVEKFVLVSTDKAVRPTNIMGASKRLAEIALQGLAEGSLGTDFCMVRFGNVLGSSGSVVPLFREQIESGGPVTVTHPDIIRYFMTIPEAAQLVLQSGALAKGGDVFVLEMGEPVRILDLAKRMVRLMGREVKDENQPYGDIEIKVTGLRPGEKLYEELLFGDNVTGTGHPMIMRAEEEYPPYAVVEDFLQELEAACSRFDCEGIRTILLELVNGFQSNGDVADYLWQKSNGKKKSESKKPVTNVAPLFPNQPLEL
ncbi:MAG: polysaccharide biosynthesis protein [Pseudomonadales bacterium]